MPLQRVRRTVIASLLALTTWAGSPHAQSSPEHAVKAGFVYNFAKFTEWPPAIDSTMPIDLCMIGPDPFGAVQKLLDNRPLQGRSLAVRRNVRIDELASCMIVFITEVDERRQAEALRSLRSLPVLTIGDADGFVDAGGMIGFITAENRIQFDVNLDASQRAGLKINSQLLALARALKGRSP